MFSLGVKLGRDDRTFSRTAFVRSLAFAMLRLSGWFLGSCCVSGVSLEGLLFVVRRYGQSHGCLSQLQSERNYGGGLDGRVKVVTRRNQAKADMPCLNHRLQHTQSEGMRCRDLAHRAPSLTTELSPLTKEEQSLPRLARSSATEAEASYASNHSIHPKGLDIQAAMMSDYPEAQTSAHADHHGAATTYRYAVGFRGLQSPPRATTDGREAVPR